MNKLFKNNCINLGIHTKQIPSKKMIISNEKIVDSVLIYTNNKQAYGILALKTRTKINDKAFNKYKKLHLLNNIEKEVRFGINDLYAYTFEVLKQFEEPKQIELYSPIETMLDCLAFINFKDIRTYNPQTVSDIELFNDHRLTHIWHNKKRRGTLKYSLEDIINLHSIIIKELSVRNMKHLILDDIDKIPASTSKMPEIKQLNTPDVTIYKDINKLVESLKDKKIVIETKLSGFRCLIYKSDSVKLYSDHGEVTKKYPSIVTSVKNSSNYDYIIDGVISNDQVYNMFDVLYFGKDISNESWSTRKLIQNKIKTFDNLKPIHSHVTSNMTELDRIITVLNKQDGVIIKGYDSKYLDNIIQVI